MKVVRSSSFINFIYPFTFNPVDFDNRAEEIEKTVWSSAKRDMPVWSRADFYKEDLLPHINRYLNAEQGNPSTAYLWNMNDDAMTSSSGLSSGKSSRWIMDSPRYEIPFAIEWIQIALFRIGIGFLTLRAMPDTDDLDAWLDFMHHFRFISGSRSLNYCVEKRTGYDKEKGCGITTRFFPEPGCRTKSGEGQLAKLLDSILSSCSGNKEQWWRDIFVQGQMIPFAGVFIGESGQDDRMIDIIYRFRNFFHSKQGFKPSRDDLSFDHPSIFEYGENQWFTLTLEGGVFVCIDPPKLQFFEGTLTSRLRNQYFLLFLLALQQRFGLLSLSDRVSEYWLMNAKMESTARKKGLMARTRKFLAGISFSDNMRVKSFEFIRGILLEFTARGHFTQVTQREKHHRFYSKCQEVFQIDKLYKEVNDEVREMHEFLSDRQSKRLEERINRLGAVIGVPAILLGLFSLTKYFNSEASQTFLHVTGITVGVTIPLSLIILWLMKR